MKLRRKLSSEEISGFLDKGTSLTGELQFSGTLRLDGNFHGTIHAGDILVVGEHAVIHADIHVSEMEIHGRVSGNLEAKRRIVIYPTGRVSGDIQTPVLVVNPGGTLDGKSRMAGEKEEEVPAAENQQLLKKEKEAIYMYHVCTDAAIGRTAHELLRRAKDQEWKTLAVNADKALRTESKPIAVSILISLY